METTGKKHTEDTIRMAREAGFERLYYGDEDWICFSHELERFAQLVRADEREEILDLVDGYAKNNTDLKEAIRARGNI